jgi:chromosome segregation ATPase
MSERNGPDIAAVYQLLTEVARIVGGHDRRFDAVDRRFDAVDRRFDAIEARLDEHDRRFDEHDRRFDEHDRRFEEHAGKLNELIVTVNGHTRKLDELADIVNRHDRKLDELAAGLADLRETLTHYHASVLGHGIMISELEERVRRIERHLHLDPAGG